MFYQPVVELVLAKLSIEDVKDVKIISGGF